MKALPIKRMTKCMIVFGIGLLFGLLFIGGFAASLRSEILTPENGAFNAYVVVPARATESERYAAEELAEYIGKITGGEISVVTEKPNLALFGFYIGLTQKGKDYAPPQKRVFDGSNGFRIKAIPGGLVIAGGDDLSTLHGVYAFLEEYQGCAWILPNELGEIIPKNKGITIPEAIDVSQVPDIPIRWMDSDDWALKMRMNVDVEIYGHPAGVINRWNYHTYGALIPDRDYLEDHPEYFSLLRVQGGYEIPQSEAPSKRVGQGRESGRGQICTSNPEALRLVSQHVINELKRNPEINFISVTPNDWFGWCECPRCQAQVIPEWKENRQGVASGPIHIFNNEVATRVKKECPGQFIKVGAYMGYLRYPPDPSYKPENNLAFMFTPHIHYCHNHAITDKSCPYIADFMAEYYKWTKNTRHIQIFAYETLHGWAQLLWPMVHILKDDMPEYHRTGVEQFFTQTGSKTQSYALNYYVASKLAWNSSLNVNDLVREFCRKSYGAAGPLMEKFHMFIEDSWEQNPKHVAYWTEQIPVSLMEFYTPEVMNTAEGFLVQAESAASDEGSKARVNLIRKEFDYLRLVLNYIKAYAEPFKGINVNDRAAMEIASKQAASIGNVLAATIVKYYRENIPEENQRGWPWTGLEGLMLSHINPAKSLNLVRSR